MSGSSLRRWLGPAGTVVLGVLGIALAWYSFGTAGTVWGVLFTLVAAGGVAEQREAHRLAFLLYPVAGLLAAAIGFVLWFGGNPGLLAGACFALAVAMVHRSYRFYRARDGE